MMTSIFWWMANRKYVLEFGNVERNKLTGVPLTVCWLAYSPQHDFWIPASKLTDCTTLDDWY